MSQTEQQPATPYVLDYDYRNDGGPRLVGPFATGADARAHADSLRCPGWSASYIVRPLTSPAPSRPSDPTETGA